MRRRLLCILLGHRRVMVVDAWGLDGNTRYASAMHPACARCGVELVDNLHDAGFQVKR